jgi:hypothetical protein
VPSHLELHARLTTIFGDELDGAGRILDEATIWLEARDAAKLRVSISEEKGDALARRQGPELGGNVLRHPNKSSIRD